MLQWRGFRSSRWTKHVPIGSSQWTAGDNSPEIHVDDAPHGLLHPAPRVLREVPAQCDPDHNPERNHHGAAAAMTANGGDPFVMPRPHQSAQSVSERTKSVQIVPPATRRPCGITRRPPTAHATSKAACSIRVGEPCAGTSSAPADVRAKDITTNVQVAETPTTEHKNAPSVSALLARLPSRAVTPYDTDGWRDLLIKYNLSHKYPDLLEQLMHGFHVWAPTITRSFMPPNNPSINVHHDAFNEILHKEFTKQRYIGPFTRDTLETFIGPFQSSPLNIIPKPGKPGKFRLIQNLSYPNSPRLDESLSINSQVDSALFPCEWGTFHTTCALIHTLPRGSQGATRDVAEAYRTIPLHPSQWPALVVRIADEPALFAVDTSLCFGYGPSAGTYGMVRDAGLDIFRAAGIGPVIAWVDDHLFFRLPCNTITNYNKICEMKAHFIAEQGGRLKENGRWWFKGEALADGTHEEFAEDCAFAVRDLTAKHPNDSTTPYAYDISHIDQISNQLGIPWELSKDTPFSSTPTFIGFTWNLENNMVSLTTAKREKYINAIHEWLRTTAHTLEQVQKLHGRLSHASLVIPEGSAYLTSLQAMLGIFSNKPFMPRRQPRGTVDELRWWLQALRSKPPIPIPHHPFAVDHRAFSDASTSYGLAIVIGNRWRAWRLHKHWKHNERDIGWAESIAFEFLIRTLLTLDQSSAPLTVHCDNQGVVDGWKKGRSRNTPTNATFRRIHDLLASPPRRVFTKYVASADNPADGPSRGKNPAAALLLPRIPIPDEITSHIFDFDDPRCDAFCV